VNDEDWQPDLDFIVELFDPRNLDENNNGIRLQGDDTKCKVTILDEDFPGTLGFEATTITCNRKDRKVDIKIVRSEGADGTISCMIKTEPLAEGQNPNNALEYDHYLPKHERITFAHSEQEQTVTI
jgi:hypothetical protein